MNIKRKAVDLDKSFIYDHDIESFNYFHKRNKPPNPVGLVISYSDRVPVNMTKSHVQVPTEIYRYDKIILNSAKKTKPLDEVFIGNYDNYSTILWQYYCSITGTFRMYPGRK